MPRNPGIIKYCFKNTIHDANSYEGSAAYNASCVLHWILKELVAPVPATLIAMLAGLMIGLFAMPKDRIATAEGQKQIEPTAEAESCCLPDRDFRHFSVLRCRTPASVGFRLLCKSQDVDAVPHPRPDFQAPSFGVFAPLSMLCVFRISLPECPQPWADEL